MYYVVRTTTLAITVILWIRVISEWDQQWMRIQVSWATARVSQSLTNSPIRSLIWKDATVRPNCVPWRHFNMWKCLHHATMVWFRSALLLASQLPGTHIRDRFSQQQKQNKLLVGVRTRTRRQTFLFPSIFSALADWQHNEQKNYVWHDLQSLSAARQRFLNCLKKFSSSLYRVTFAQTKLHISWCCRDKHIYTVYTHTQGLERFI